MDDYKMEMVELLLGRAIHTIDGESMNNMYLEEAAQDVKDALKIIIEDYRGPDYYLND